MLRASQVVVDIDKFATLSARGRGDLDSIFGPGDEVAGAVKGQHPRSPSGRRSCAKTVPNRVKIRAFELAKKRWNSPVDELSVNFSGLGHGSKPRLLSEDLSGVLVAGQDPTEQLL